MNIIRRKRIEKIADELANLAEELQQLADEEQEAFDNMPETFQDGERGETMQGNVDLLTEQSEAIANAADELGGIE